MNFADKMLVLIDGRSIYTAGFGGVIWGMENPMMEDLDRIEVIRGPGGSLWGANAVNGVINIITKSAKETQGGLISVDAGNEDRTGCSRWLRRRACDESLLSGFYVKKFNRAGLEKNERGLCAGSVERHYGRNAAGLGAYDSKHADVAGRFVQLSCDGKSVDAESYATLRANPERD